MLEEKTRLLKELKTALERTGRPPEEGAEEEPYGKGSWAPADRRAGEEEEPPGRRLARGGDTGAGGQIVEGRDRLFCSRGAPGAGF